MTRRAPPPSRLKTHTYTADPSVPPDRDGRHYCTCGAPELHPRHTLPTPDPDTRAVTARITGEDRDED